MATPASEQNEQCIEEEDDEVNGEGERIKIYASGVRF